MKLEAVIFDLDGVITDTAHFHFIAWQKIAGEIGIDIDEQFNEQLKGISRLDSLHRILVHGGKRFDFSTEQINQLAERKNQIYVALLDQLSPAAILPGISDLLKELRQQQIRIGLASVSRNAPQVLAALHLTSQFDFCADANKIQHSKPDPEIFLTACAGLGIDPSRAIGIEDAQAGIEAIKASGMLAIGVGQALTHADWLIPSTQYLNMNALQTLWDRHAASLSTRT
ncbi:beta-phosphoglucomutase [Limnobaculum parvum]|uniref:Beta-phosphoglucomutase n=1 Tax=Limnobaculum parvum TaxID=2172103 RepID=A0A2Y9U023_9GAMM|nr:beta-phosphoglucomutase [Limnobaculum parvum]AWH88994.1 beta-phosphoglucomutase [Limnobaculum parvum]